LTEPLQARERDIDGFALESALLVEPGAEAHALAQTIKNDELPVRMTGHDHVKAVGT
jgi:hypothetical protein